MILRKYHPISVPRLAAAVTSTNTQLSQVTGTVSSQDVVRSRAGEGGEWHDVREETGGPDVTV